MEEEKKEVVEEKLPVMTGTEKLGYFPRKDKIAIIGCAETTKVTAMLLFGKPGWEFWGINTLHKVFPELMAKAGEIPIRWFQIHSKDRFLMQKRDEDHWKWLQAQTKFPIYTIEAFPEVPMSVPYPKDEIIAEFGDYFTNSVSWMLALAIYERPKEIHLYGVEMALSDEYMYQRPSVEYYIGLARGLGIKVFLPDRCDLLKSTTLYGYQDHSTVKLKLREQTKEFNARVAMHERTKMELMFERGKIIGRINIARQQKYTDYEKDVSQWEKQANTILAQEGELTKQIWTLKGGLEMVQYMKRVWMHEMGGDI